MTPFNLERTNCCVLSSSSSSEAGRALTQEVLLRASFIIALSSESAAPATTSVNDGVQSTAASTDREKLARAEQRIWGDNLDALHLPMSRHPPPPGRARPRGGGRDHRRWLWYQRATASRPWCEPITSHG
jgi:hypothetical protein